MISLQDVVSESSKEELFKANSGDKFLLIRKFELYSWRNTFTIREIVVGFNNIVKHRFDKDLFIYKVNKEYSVFNLEGENFISKLSKMSDDDNDSEHLFNKIGTDVFVDDGSYDEFYAYCVGLTLKQGVFQVKIIPGTDGKILLHDESGHSGSRDFSYGIRKNKYQQGGYQMLGDEAFNRFYLFPTGLLDGSVICEPGYTRGLNSKITSHDWHKNPDRN